MKSQLQDKQACQGTFEGFEDSFVIYANIQRLHPAAVLFSVLIIYFTVKGNNLFYPKMLRISVSTTISDVSETNLD